MLSFFFLLILSSACSQFIETSFSTIENGPSNSLNIAYFYRSEVPSSLDGLNVLESMIELISKEYKDMKYYKCDGSREENSNLYKQAGFGNDGYIYIQMNDVIDSYRHELQYDRIMKHIRSMMLQPASDLLIEFKHEIQFNELFKRRNPKPLLVHFNIPVCAPCDDLKPAFNRYAQYFKDQLHLLSINCEYDEDAISFCTKIGINSYPTVMLFKSESKKFKLDGVDLTFTAIDKFLSSNGIRVVGKAKEKVDL